MTRLTDADLAELLAGITPGPWSFLDFGMDEPEDQMIYGRSTERRPVAKTFYWSDYHDGSDSETKANAQAIARVPDLLVDLIAAREALRGMTEIFEQMLAHPDDTMYDARFWKQIAREGIAQGEIG